MNAEQITPSNDSFREDDEAFFRRRARWHQDLAAATEDASTRALHERFVALYHAKLGLKLVHSS